MAEYKVLLLTVICIWIIIWVIIVCNNYSPKIDIVVSWRKYTVLLWYNKWYWGGECKRTYIKLFEI